MDTKEIHRVKITFINKSENYIFGDDIMDISETEIETLADLYKYCSKEYGKCVSKMYVDRIKDAIHIGYVFEKAVEYEDTKEKYIRETWASIEHYIEKTDRKYIEVK